MILLVGKTCTGKDTIQKELVRMGMNAVVSYTTRPPRKNEINGVDYCFITREEFRDREKQGFFAETTSYHVANGETWYYGSAVEDLTDDKVIIVNPHGLRQIKKIESLHPVVFCITASDETLWNRLRKRGDNLSEARRRLEADNKDFKDIEEYVDFSFNNDAGSDPKILAEMILRIYRTKKGK